MSVQPVPPALPGARPLSMREQAQRTEALGCLTVSSLPCSMHVNIGIFFDGTNNNRQRDQLDVRAKTEDPNKCSHSNVVVLFDTFRDAPADGYYRFYIPGVGTAFPEIGEQTETPDGKSQASGGDARINFALLQVLNAMHFVVFKSPLMSDAQLGRTATTWPLHAGGWEPGNNLQKKRQYLQEKIAELRARLRQQLPKRIAQVNLSVFGFSRGAAQARAFCHFLHHGMLQEEGGGYTLAGVPFRTQFLGLFDSVASVGLADSSPFWRGLGGWANGTLDIVPSVERTVHLCAAHEIRINFPLSTGRIRKAYPANCIEKVYPGAHSDVGGGYEPGCQGKAVGSRSKLLSQMPLLDMYREARASGVPLQSVQELLQTEDGKKVAADLEMDVEHVKLFNAYREWSASVASAGAVEQVLRGHMQLYWRWRLRHLGAVQALASFAAASAQDQTDLRESDGDFASDALNAQAMGQERDAAVHGRIAPAAPSLTDAQEDFLRMRKSRATAGAVAADVEKFFDLMVHDSHASFYMVGPVTDFDRQEKIRQIEAKLADLRARDATMQRVGAIAGAGAGRGRADGWPLSLSDLEQRIYLHQRTGTGGFPPLTDADREQLLAMENFSTRGAVRLVTRKTRRELGGHVRYRRVFDGS